MAPHAGQSLAALTRMHPEIGPATALTPLGEGFGAHLYAAPNGVIVRIPRTIDAGRRMAAIAAVAALAGHLPAPMPVPLWIEAATPGLPFGAMAYARLPGIALEPGDTMVSGDVARFLATLHTIEPAGLGINLSAVPDRTAVDTERREAMAIALPWLRQRVPATVHARLESWWDRYQEFRAGEPFRPAIVHGDFWYGNLLGNDDATRLTGVLDWEQAAIDDPAQDYATLLHSGTRFANQVLETACGLSGQDVESMFQRRDWHWGYREFSGLAVSIAAGDIAEADESLAKLRAGALKDLFT